MRTGNFGNTDQIVRQVVKRIGKTGINRTRRYGAPVTGALKEESPIELLMFVERPPIVRPAKSILQQHVVTERKFVILADHCVAEPHRRGPYGGAVGYVDFSGNMDTCIALRTLVLKGQTAYLQAGAGIVADSVPEKEYEETLNKAMGLLRALEIAETQL